MATYKIVQDHESCIGCGMCVSICPDNWEIGDDGLAHPIKTTISDAEYDCNKEAANACPVSCIKIE